ncbi:DUF6461 domain-containing protein [Nocardia sp. CC227C]|uniref:DUF6461 domain-containing protein n=1 Tax=Nocardia sp. CC227C TaxID=3044562 RepID=UPI00278BF3EF|nr:DUF6461 domain-containing protein [Nocardia sp. CC227C]
MTTADPRAPFEWLAASESQASPLGVLFSVAFFRGLDRSEVVRRFNNGEDSSQELDFQQLNDRMVEFLGKTDGGSGGGHVGVFPAGEWSVAIEPCGFWATDSDVLADLSRGCAVLAITRHDYARHSLAYAIDSTLVTAHALEIPHIRWGTDPDRLNDYMRELGMVLDSSDNEIDWDAAGNTTYNILVPRAFALAAKVTGVSFTPDMLNEPLLVGPIAYR